jgi:methyl acetate hydrolase
MPGAHHGFAIREARSHYGLTHTSGYGYDIFNPDLCRYIEVVRLPSIMSRKNDSLRVPLLFDPGTGWEYGIGIDLAGKVVETVTGQTLEAYFRQHIFEPLGMRDTSFLLSDDMARRLVGTHVRGADGKPAPISFESSRHGDVYPGGAGLFSTARDYLAFTRMLLAGGTISGLALEVETFLGQVKKWGLTFLINTKDVEGLTYVASPTAAPRQASVAESPVALPPVSVESHHALSHALNPPPSNARR